MKHAHMLKRFVLALFLIQAVVLTGFSQNRVSLVDLYAAIEKNHPYQRMAAIAKSTEENQKKINALSRIPQASFLGQASWQSDVTEIPVVLPGLDIPGQPRDQYRALLELSQLIYDGGQRKAQDEQSVRAYDMDLAGTQVMIHPLKELVCKTFFSVLLADLSIRQWSLLAEDLEKKAARLNRQIGEGMAAGSQEAALQIKIRETNQAMLEIKKQKSNALSSLELLTGMSLDSSMQFVPSLSPEDLAGTRPELALFEAQRKFQAASFSLSQTRFQPKVQLFGQLGYGRPGLNLLSDEFKPYTILGLKWQWNLNNLYSRQGQREKDLLQAGLDKIKVQEESFNLQEKIRIRAQETEIEHLGRLLLEDEAVIALHERVLKSSEAQLETGVATVNEYATDANNLTQARIKKDMHQIQLLQSKELLNLIHGKR
ncbi:MAG TPA: TolC family protein [Saprospiraceae bacterium]|nr:TolC family protein [Saprospiraceae bacterium]HNT21353.1 TolC family protein [Saprospiraceae bacterium]